MNKSSNYDIFKPLKNKIKSISSPLDIILSCSKKCYEIKNLNNSNSNYLPWELLLLIKYTFIYGEFNQQKKELNKHRFDALLNKVKSFSDRLDNKFLNSDHEKGIEKFVRQLAFQQFFFQDKMRKIIFGRQIILFSNDSSFYSQKFKNSTGLDLKEFFQLEFMLWATFNNQIIYDDDFFKNITMHYGEDTIKRFLNLFALDYDSAKELCERNHDLKNIQYEIIEQSPLVQFPILKHDNKYLCYSKKLLKERISNFIYDYLKSKISGEFCQEFGKTFERYVERLIRHFNIDYINESCLKKVKKDGGSVVDYILKSENSSILIECKAIEMPKETKENPTDRRLINSIKKTIVRGIDQINAVYKFSSNTSEIPTSKFGLVLTYKEFYLGTAKQCWDEFLKNEVDNESKYLNETCLDLERIFIVSIKNFESLLNFSDGNLDTIMNWLEEFVKKNKDFETRSFYLGAFLNEYSKNDKISFLEEAFTRNFQECEAILKGK